MNCSELRDHYELYCIGVAGEPERSEIGAHLDRQCTVCTQGVKRARAVVERVGGAARTSARAERRRFGWTLSLALALALALFAAVYFGGRERDLANELARVREQILPSHPNSAACTSDTAPDVPQCASPTCACTAHTCRPYFSVSSFFRIIAHFVLDISILL